MEKSAVVTEKAAVVYQRRRWLVSNVSDVRIMWNITAVEVDGDRGGAETTRTIKQ
jgi:hypothetical protein